jgi:NADH-quinone oxidoreductase subunit M
MGHLLSIAACAPAAGAMAILAVAPRRTAWIRAIAALSAAISFSSSFLLWRGFHPRAAEWQFTEQFAWLPRLGASYSVGVDGFGLLLLLLTTLIGLAVALTSWDATAEDAKPRAIAMLALLTGLVGLFVALDFLLLLACWIVTLAAMGFLIRYPERRTALIAVGALASVACLAAGIFVLASHAQSLTGVWSFDIRSYRQLAVAPAVQPWIFFAFLLAIAIPMGLFPFHGWLVGGARAPLGASTLCAALLTKIGFYFFVRVSLPVLPDATRRFAPMLLGLCLIGVVYLAVRAFAQTEWRRVLAFATASHVSFAMLGAVALTPDGLTGSMVHQISQGITVGALFLIAAAIYGRNPSWRPADRRFAAALFIVAALAFAGAPLTSGFIGVRLIVRGIWPVSAPTAVVAAGGVLLCAGCVLWLAWRALAGIIVQRADGPGGPASWRDLAIPLPMVAIALWIGLYPAPFLWRLETAVARVVLRVSPEYAPQVADCLSAPQTPPPPDPSGLPGGMVLAAPCADQSAAGKDKKDR